MRETFTEFDILQEAMKKINLDDEAMPIYNGKVLMKETAEAYKKMQLILDTPELHSAHKFIYNLDPEQLSEDEIDQVNKIFSLGVNRGFIEDPACGSEGEELIQPAQNVETTDQSASTQTLQKALAYSPKIPCWTVLYSATKNGEIKTGECYSNSIDPRSAKADCIAKLSRCGYENVSILALEQGDPDSCGFKSDECCKPATVEAKADDVVPAKVDEVENDELSKEKEIDESGELGTYKMTLTLSDVDPETFLKGHVDSWIEDIKGKFQAVEVIKKGMTEDGVEVEVIGSYDVLEQIYADYLKYDDIYSLEHSKYDFDEFKSSITQVNEDEGSLRESGNPYAAGLKTTDIGGVSKVGASSQKKEIKEEDDDSSKEETKDDDKSDDSSDSDESTDDASSEDDDSSADDSSDDSSSSSDAEDDKDDSDDSDSASDDTEDDTESDDADSKDDSDDNSNDDESSDSDSDDSSDESSDSDDAEEDSGNEEDNDSEDDSSEDDSESDDKDDNKDDELSDEEKAELKNEYKKTFKDVLLKCKFEDMCFDDLTINQKVKFFTELGKKWGKNEPADFMSDKEIEQLNKVVVKK